MILLLLASLLLVRLGLLWAYNLSLAIGADYALDIASPGELRAIQALRLAHFEAGCPKLVWTARGRVVRDWCRARRKHQSTKPRSWSNP